MPNISIGWSTQFRRKIARKPLFLLTQKSTCLQIYNQARRQPRAMYSPPWNFSRAAKNRPQTLINPHLKVDRFMDFAAQTTRQKRIVSAARWHKLQLVIARLDKTSGLEFANSWSGTAPDLFPEGLNQRGKTRSCCCCSCFLLSLSIYIRWLWFRRHIWCDVRIPAMTGCLAGVICPSHLMWFGRHICYDLDVTSYISLVL